MDTATVVLSVAVVLGGGGVLAVVLGGRFVGRADHPHTVAVRRLLANHSWLGHAKDVDGPA